MSIQVGSKVRLAPDGERKYRIIALDWRRLTGTVIAYYDVNSLSDRVTLAPDARDLRAEPSLLALVKVVPTMSPVPAIVEDLREVE